METPTPPISLDNLDKPILRPGDSTYPSPDPDKINPENGLRTDYRSMDTPAVTAEVLAAHGAGVSDVSFPVTPPETPLLNKEPNLHRQLLQNLLAKQGSSPPVSPLGTEQSIVTMPTSAIDTELTQRQSSSDTVYPYDTASRASGSELDESDAVFSPPITPEPISPPTPVSDLEEYFPVISDRGEESADHKLSELGSSDTDSLRSLDTVHPQSPYIKEISQEEFPTPETPGLSSDLDALDYGASAVESLSSPPPSHTPSPTQSEANSLVLLAVSPDGSVSNIPFDVISADSDNIVVSIGPS